MHFEKIHKLFSPTLSRCTKMYNLFAYFHYYSSKVGSIFKLLSDWKKKWMTLSCSYVESVLSGD